MQPASARPFHRPGWVFEEKIDGWRMVAHKDGRAVQLLSRQGVEHTERFPGVVAAVAQLPARRLILDGEVAVFDEQLISRFGWLADSPASAVATPPVFVAFDCLMINGRDLRARPLRERRLELERAIAGSDVLPARRLASDESPSWMDSWCWFRTSSKPCAWASSMVSSSGTANMSRVNGMGPCRTFMIIRPPFRIKDARFGMARRRCGASRCIQTPVSMTRSNVSARPRRTARSGNGGTSLPRGARIFTMRQPAGPRETHGLNGYSQRRTDAL